MTDYHDIYQTGAERYDRLVSREDDEGNIQKSLSHLIPLKTQSIVELGCGTGRLTTLLAQLGQQVFAFDASLAMLEVAEAKLQQMSISNCSLQIADHRRLPVGDGIADVVVAGWTICHLVDDNPQEWRTELVKVFFELDRVLRSQGMMIILETLGTGFETPHPPDHLRDYYRVLEKELGFTKRWIRTDYRFESLQEAELLSSFFFGDELAERVVEEGLMILPECTGVWVNVKDIQGKPDEIR